MRPLRLILACVLLGVVTTVGVAWGIGFSPKRATSSQQFFMNGSPSGFAFGGFGWGSVYFPEPVTGPIVMSGYADTPPPWVSENMFAPNTSVVACGWPSLSMLFSTGSVTWRYALLQRPLRPQQAPSALPLRPLPLGFAVDTIFYGSIWFGLIMCPGLVRRKMRQRRGLCPSCGYDMRGSEGVCSECGS